MPSVSFSHASTSSNRRGQRTAVVGVERVAGAGFAEERDSDRVRDRATSRAASIERAVERGELCARLPGSVSSAPHLISASKTWRFACLGIRRVW